MLPRVFDGFHSLPLAPLEKEEWGWVGVHRKYPHMLDETWGCCGNGFSASPKGMWNFPWDEASSERAYSYDRWLQVGMPENCDKSGNGSKNHWCSLIHSMSKNTLGFAPVVPKRYAIDYIFTLCRLSIEMNGVDYIVTT